MELSEKARQDRILLLGRRGGGGKPQFIAPFTGELVRLAANARMQRGFCLVDLTDSDLIKNWYAAALWDRMPLFVWNAEMRMCKLGPDPSAGLGKTLQYVLSVERGTSSEVAKALQLKTQNARSSLKQLWTEGFILRQERSRDEWRSRIRIPAYCVIHF